MSAPKCGRSAAIWGEIGLDTRLVGQKLGSMPFCMELDPQHQCVVRA